MYQCHDCLSYDWPDGQPFIKDAQALSEAVKVENFSVKVFDLGPGKISHSVGCTKLLLYPWHIVRSNHCTINVPREHSPLAAQVSHEIASNIPTVNLESYIYKPLRLLRDVLWLSERRCVLFHVQELRYSHRAKLSRSPAKLPLFGEHESLITIMQDLDNTDITWDIYKARHLATKVLLRLYAYYASTERFLVRRLNGSQVRKDASIGYWMRMMMKKRQYQLKLIHEGQRRLRRTAKLLYIDLKTVKDNTE